MGVILWPLWHNPCSFLIRREKWFIGNTSRKGKFLHDDLHSIVLERDPDMVFRHLGEEMVLVPIRRGIGDFNSFYVLNTLGAFIWNRIEKPTAAALVLENIVQAFAVEEAQARNDLQAFVTKLVELKALKPHLGVVK